jgi:hypothetical protein
MSYSNYFLYIILIILFKSHFIIFIKNKNKKTKGERPFQKNVRHTWGCNDRSFIHKVNVNITKKTLILFKNNVIFKLFFIYYFNNLI